MSDPTPLLAPLKPAVCEARVWSPRGFIIDPWRYLDDGEQCPANGHAIVPLTRWRTESDLRNGPIVGVEVQPTDVLEADLVDIARLPLVVLVFPKFTDGRAYSTARRLRGHWGYRGEIRARGDVLLDQLPLMLDCGFDSFEIRDAATLRSLERGYTPTVARRYDPPGSRMRRSPISSRSQAALAAAE